MEEELRYSTSWRGKDGGCRIAMRKEQLLQRSWHAHIHELDEGQLARTTCHHTPPVAVMFYKSPRPITRIQKAQKQKEDITRNS